ncbi:hypothetical protein L486_02569 [Kwoniella mangroviensis CBS 10435]|uniref:FHA domain-containing protein n=1 Tax=Kwoniella mangroviensis CBS 10435 TaxID=1331196 RepID=A0A1B9IWJ6_9TREE|nr:hypothetical protein L486_02569 [Kwoniella mangroviensis CBS 10435]
MPCGPPPVTYGRLTLMKRKGGGDVQTIPLDAERITFGRDYDCDVRLYYSDVSKLHCEIVFDAISGKAILHVRGTNGLLHSPSGGTGTSYKPPFEIPLDDKDVITIRKKPFRFEYGPSLETPVPFSPAIKLCSTFSADPSPSKQQLIRRRASHRLSLVPEGKTFVPLSPIKNRRHSTLGLGGMGTPGKAAAKSKLSEEVPQEQEEEENAEESVLDVANGDEGDKIYLEVNEEENKENENPSRSIKRIHENPFITPQQTRKAPLRNTSAVPRTKRMAATENTEPKQIDDKSTSPVSKDAPAPATPPKTPRSVPLPTTGDTPYNPPATPSYQKVSSTPVPARVALSTPKGPATLRKALLLRSARKVWQESRASGVEGAIEAGNVETRRKSTSPKTRAGRKSTTPIPEVPAPQPEDQDMSDEGEDEAGEPQNGELIWVHEDGTAEVSFESDSSGYDSLEADQSLDIPGQSVIEFTINHPEVEEEYINNDDGFLEHELPEDEVMDIEKEAHEAEVYEEYEQAVNIPADDSVEEVQPQNLNQGEHQDEENEEDEVMSLPGTPQTRQPLSKQFYTPQPERNIHRLPRRSLANIGGPPVRFERLPATPDLFKRERAPPGSMGKPSKRITFAAPDAEDEMKAIDNEPVPEKKVFMTPVKSEAAKAEAKRRRESLATPRQLPAPPVSGFKNPIVETRFSNLIAKPSHPALAADSPILERSDESRAVPGTPMDDIKHRLDKMRRQSVQRADRRATVGFVLPSTPSRPKFREAGSWSVNPRRIDGKGPTTPIFPKFKTEDRIGESPSELVATASHQESSTMAQARAQLQAPSSPDYETPSSPSTPSYTGIREMLGKPSLPAKTPDMRGLKNLFPATPKEAASPSLVGVKELLRQPSVPATPNLTGMKDMFKQPKIAQTPGFEGIGEMFDGQEEEEKEEKEEVEAAEESVIAVDVEGHVNNVTTKQVGACTSSASSKLPRPATSTSTSAASRSRRAPAPSTTTTAKPTTRVPARKAAFSAHSTAETESKSSRSRKAKPAVDSKVTEEPKSRSTRTKRTTSMDPEPSSAPSRTTSASRSRSLRARSTAEPEDQAQAQAEETSKSTRRKSTSARTTRQATAEAEEASATATSRSSRGKKPLTQLPEQPIEGEKKSTPASTRSKLPTSAAAAKKASASKVEEKRSAPSRRKATTTTNTSSSIVGNKENDDGQEEKSSAGAGSKKRIVGQGGVSPPVVGTTRTTRSRK